jgi:hypothetical protein
VAREQGKGGCGLMMFFAFIGFAVVAFVVILMG